MNHVLRNASRACLSRSSRAGGPAAGALNLNGPSRILPSGTYMAQRFNSSGVDKSFGGPSISSDLSSQATQFPGDTSAIGDALTDAAVSVAIATPDAPGFATGHIMAAIDYLHTFADIPYWGAIAAFTVGVRLLMLPIAINTIRGSARMAAMRPEMQKVQDQFTNNPNQADAAVRERYQAEMKALFVKHKCNPMRALLWPIAQFPIFMGFFLALKEMGVHYPGFATGGAYWFTDLSAADPTMILPIFNALSFLAMIELGSDGVQMQNQSTFKMVMRGLAVAMVPLTMDFSTGLFVYWCTNNCISLVQTGVLKNENVRKTLDIPKPPAPENTPNLQIKNPFAAVQEMIAKNQDKMKSNAAAEILDGVVTAPKAPMAAAAVAKPPPMTFTMPPRQARRKEA